MCEWVPVSDVCGVCLRVLLYVCVCVWSLCVCMYVHMCVERRMDGCMDMWVSGWVFG